MPNVNVLNDHFMKRLWSKKNNINYTMIYSDLKANYEAGLTSRPQPLNPTSRPQLLNPTRRKNPTSNQNLRWVVFLNDKNYLMTMFVNLTFWSHIGCGLGRRQLNKLCIKITYFDVARAENFRMVDIEINAWSPLFLNLQIEYCLFSSWI